MELDKDRPKSSEPATKPTTHSGRHRQKGHNTRLERFLNDPVCRESQSNIGWDENTCNTYDEIAKEDHSSVATRGERSRNENSWRLVLNAQGANGPLDQRDDHQEM